MKRVLILGLALVTLMAFDSSAEAGRRRDRRTARKGGGGVYAGAYQRQTNHVYPVAKASFTESQTALVAVGAASGMDLTVTNIAVEGSGLCVTVKNVGQTASPETRLEVAVTKAHAVEIDVQNVRILPLLPKQAVKIHFTTAPSADSQVEALVDPDRLLAETSKDNNSFRVVLIDTASADEPPLLTDGASGSNDHS